MREEQVPQDNSPSYDGHNKLLYAVDKSGHYKEVKSSGWEVESFATQMAINDLDQLTLDALKGVKEGKLSPLAYHMYKQRLDIPTLAQTSGFFQWQVRRHLKPEIFNRLSTRKIAIYCELFAMSAEQLASVADHHD